MKAVRWLAMLVLTISVAALCARNGTFGTWHAKEKKITAARKNPAAPKIYIARASWYGPGFYHRTTASGEKYLKSKIFVASKTLPFGTRLKVTNLRNNREVAVAVKDRGPYIRGRSLDFSYEAAKRLGMIREGVARVAYEIVPQKTKQSPTDQESRP